MCISHFKKGRGSCCLEVGRSCYIVIVTAGCTDGNTCRLLELWLEWSRVKVGGSFLRLLHDRIMQTKQLYHNSWFWYLFIHVVSTTCIIPYYLFNTIRFCFIFVSQEKQANKPLSYPILHLCHSLNTLHIYWIVLSVKEWHTINSFLHELCTTVTLLAYTEAKQSQTL